MSQPVPFVKYADPAFTAERTRYCELRCLISESELVIAVYDVLAAQFRLIERYPLKNSYNKSKPSEVLARILQTHPLTRLEFKRIEVIPDSFSWQLVPIELFDEDFCEGYLLTGNESEEFQEIAHEYLADRKRVLVYTWPSSWKNIIDSQFPEVRVRHHAAVLFEMLLRGALNGHTVFAYVHDFKLDVLVVSDGKPLLYNSFIFQSPEDFVYYLGLIYEQMNFNRESDALILAGEIEEGSAIHQSCFKYFRHISFSARPDDLPVPASPEGFPEISKHAYFTLLHPYDSDY
jgi:hypothetical protein